MHIETYAFPYFHDHFFRSVHSKQKKNCRMRTDGEDVADVGARLRLRASDLDSRLGLGWENVNGSRGDNDTTTSGWILEGKSSSATQATHFPLPLNSARHNNNSEQQKQQQQQKKKKEKKNTTSRENSIKLL